MDPSSLKGHIVDLFYRDKIYPAYVKEIKGKRLNVLLLTGKEESVAFSAVISAGSKLKVEASLDAVQQALKESQRLREELRQLFNLEELWEVVKGELSVASPAELVELYLGKPPSPDEVCAFVRLILEVRLYFRFRALDEVEILSEDEVRSILHQRKKEQGREALRQSYRSFLVRLLSDEPLGELSSAEESLLEALKGFVIHEEPQALSKDLFSQLSEHNLAHPHKILNLLIKKGIFKEDENLDLLKYSFLSDFSEDALEQTKACLAIGLKELPDFERFEDLTSLETYAVDAQETQDVDDAFSIEDHGDRLVFYVHIADVASFVPIGSPLFEQALQRASTLYLPDEIIPMLPFDLSHDKFSLLEAVDRAALTFRIEIKPQPFEILSFKIMPSVIRVKQRFTYEEIDSYLEQGYPFWNRMYKILLEHKKLRLSQGAMAVFLPEVTVRVTQDGEIQLKRLEMTPARDLISELMILTNHLSAKFGDEEGIVMPYRKQDLPFQVFAEAEHSWYYKILQLRNFAKSELTLEPGFHSGLGLSHYTTLTSPIRRVVDLIVHHQIHGHLFSKKALSKEDLQALLPEVEENLRRTQAIQQRRHRYFLLKYLARHYLGKGVVEQGEPLSGVVVEKRERLLKVYLPEFNLTGEVKGSFPQVNLGDEVTLEIERVEPRQEVLLLKIV